MSWETFADCRLHAVTVGLPLGDPSKRSRFLPETKLPDAKPAYLFRLGDFPDGQPKQLPGPASSCHVINTTRGVSIQETFTRPSFKEQYQLYPDLSDFAFPSPASATMSKLYDNVDVQQLQQDADDCLLHYGTEFHPEVITNAEGIYIETASGHRMMDFTSGQMSCLIGHGNPEIVQVIQDHAKNLDHVFSGMLTPPVIRLAKRLTSLTPPGLDKAFFLSTGGESNEAAIRLAKFYTGKFEIVGLAASWHGMTGVAVAAQYHAGRAGYGPNMAGNLALPTPNAYRSIFRNCDGSYDWQTELDYGFDLVDKQSCGSLAAVIVEPILSSGGMLTLPEGYLKALKQHCERRGMLMIVDEAQTAICRAGDMFAFEHEGVIPDILTLSKTLGNGLPMSAVVTSNSIAEFAKENHFLFYTTHINDPIPAAVADKVLEIVVRDGLVERSRKLGERLQRGLRLLQSRYGCIGDVRGRGLMQGMEIVASRETKVGAPEVGNAVGSNMTNMGLWAQLATMSSFGGVFRIAPPITVTEEQLDTALAIMEAAFSSTPGTQPLYASESSVADVQPFTVEIASRL